MDMKNIDRLAVWREGKKLLRQPTLTAKDLTVNPNQTEPGKERLNSEFFWGGHLACIFFLYMFLHFIIP